MIEYYLPAVLKLCRLAATVRLLASIRDLLVVNIGLDFYCLMEVFFVVLLDCNQLCQTDTREVPQNEALLFRSTSNQTHYSHHPTILILQSNV